MKNSGKLGYVSCILRPEALDIGYLDPLGRVRNMYQVPKSIAAMACKPARLDHLGTRHQAALKGRSQWSLAFTI